MTVDFASLRDSNPSTMSAAVSQWKSVREDMGEAAVAGLNDVSSPMRQSSWRGKSAEAAIEQTEKYETQVGHGRDEAATIQDIVTDAMEMLVAAKEKLDAALEEIASHPQLSIDDSGSISVLGADGLGSLDATAASAVIEEAAEDQERLGVAVRQAVAEAQLIDIEASQALNAAVGETGEFNPDAISGGLDRDLLEDMVVELRNHDNGETVDIAFGMETLNASEYEVWKELTLAQQIAMFQAQDDAADKIPYDLEAGAHNGDGDAFRHAYWNARMANDVSPDVAERFANAHENGKPGVGQGGSPPNEVMMDLHNNEVGRRIAAENPNASNGELANLVERAVRNGEMLVLDSDGNLKPSGG